MEKAPIEISIPLPEEIPGAELKPPPIDFGQDVVGFDFKKDYKEGIYLAEVRSKENGNSPTCLYSEADKTYGAESGTIGGEEVQAEFDVYELDLQGIDFSIEDLDEVALKELIESNKDKITVTKLNAGETYTIPRGIIHQVRGKGIIRIWVPSGYKEGKMIEKDAVSLIDYYQEK